MRSFYLLFCFFCLSSHLAIGQGSVDLQVQSQDAAEDILNRYKFKQKQADSLSAARTVQELVVALHNDGYLLAQFISAELEGSIFSAKIEVGPPFKWLRLRSGNVDPLLLRKISFQKFNLDASRFNYQELAKVENALLRYAERNGHPFAALRYDSLLIIEQDISASLNLALGPKITFDSLRVDKNILKRGFLESYLGIQMGDLYDERRIERTVQQLNLLPFIKVSRPPELTFQNEEATLKLTLDKRRINRIDGIIGFLPQSSNDNGLLITGQFDMDLYNPFQTGKYIGIHWRSPEEKSQSLNMVYKHPNVFRSPLSFKGAFDFLKQDTSFTKVSFRADIDISSGRASSISVFTAVTSSRLLSVDQFENSTTLPPFADIDQTLYGLSYNLSRLDDPLLPKSGFSVYASAGLGNRRINQIDELPSDLYQGLSLRSVQYQIDLNAAYYLAIKPKWNVKLALNGGWIDNQNLFSNDAYRIGGLNTVRGFDENFFFATKYISNTIENRFYFESNSYLSLFTDLGVLENIEREKADEMFIGFGAGISFETQRGIFNLVYALGTSETAGALNLNSSKIHFGFTTRF